jgi:hypothetical protein
MAAENRHSNPEENDHDYPKNDFNHAGQAIIELGEMLQFAKGYSCAP